MKLKEKMEKEIHRRSQLLSQISAACSSDDLTECNHKSCEFSG